MRVNTHGKTAILASLVILSLVQSYVLWQGNWQEAGSVSLSDGKTLTQTATPQARDATAPYRIVFARQNNAVSLGAPDTPLYAEWIKRLAGVKVTNLRPVSETQKPAPKSVTYDFGTGLDARMLEQWMPGLQFTGMMGAIHTITLYTAGDKHPVAVRLDGDTLSFVGETNVASAKFVSDVNQIIGNSPWRSWNATDDTYLPDTGIPMQKMEYQLDNPPVLELVHSFFVNPRALSRIQEDKDTVLWTDGSRIVWWNDQDNTVTYADPNTSASLTSSQSDMNAALEYIRNHGGAMSNTVFTKSDTASGRESFTLRTYINGFPVVGGQSDIAIQLDKGKVIQFARPLRQFTTRVSETTINTMSFKQLVAVLGALSPLKSTGGGLQRTLSAELGYYLQHTSADEVALTPVYYVSDNGMPVWILDAESGKVIKGMSKP